MPTPPMTRRAALAAAAGGAALLAAGPLRAAAPMLGPLRPGFRRFALGAFEVTVLSDGFAISDNPAGTFGVDQTPETVAALAAENLLPTDRLQNNFNVTLVNTGAQVVLFDTGNAASRGPTTGMTRARLIESGVQPEQVDVVVITHMHGDHIGGLMVDGKPAYPNARYVTGAVEHNFWTGAGAPEQGAANVKARFTPLAEKAAFIDAGASIAPGIDAVATHGHTPGHMAYHVESEGKRLMITADLVNHFVLSLQRPDWHVRFDMDKAAGAATRRQVLGMLAADRIPFVGYHMPSPALGFVETAGDSFRYVPETYQTAV